MNETIQPTPSRGAFALKLLLFGVTLALFAVGAAGYVYGKSSGPAPIASTTTPEQTHYKQLTYVANEMHYQLERWRASPQAAAALAKDKAYIDSLMAALTDAPEELIVAQAIVDDLHRAYADAYDALRGGAADPGFEDADAHYRKFLDNAILIQNFSQYEGLNVICH